MRNEYTKDCSLFLTDVYFTPKVFNIPVQYSCTFHTGEASHKPGTPDR